MGYNKKLAARGEVGLPVASARSQWNQKRLSPVYESKKQISVANGIRKACTHSKEICFFTLAGVAQLVELCPVCQKVTGWILDQDTFLGCRFSSRSGFPSWGALVGLRAGGN